ncbi:MAG TPA: Fic family protein [Pirellulales bacterium]|nr:Fic family protein [Pirellulales bacterium]
MPYIHKLPGWPTLTWDGDFLASSLAAVRHKQGRLLGKMEAMGFDLRAEASLTVLTSDVVKSSAIEGETLNPEEVRSSIARRLGLDVAGLAKSGRDVEGIVEMMLDATGRFSEPLTKDRLFAWHASLFPTGRSGMAKIAVGQWRPKEAGEMHVVSGPIGRERIHFRAPSADRLESEMATFINWFNASAGIDPVLRAGIAHLWFVTIHPFEDGNGRIARAIADITLARADGTKDRFYSMSSEIAAERKAYYRELEIAQRGDLDTTRWLGWFLDCLSRTIDGADELLASVLHKAHLWQRINRKPVNERQRLVINRLLDDFKGFLTTSKYAKLAKCSPDTALRDIRELLGRGILVQNPSGGRSTSYRLAEPGDIPA